MLIHPIRETRVFQEGVEEGIPQGIELGIQQERQRWHQEKLKIAMEIAALKIGANDIARILELDIMDVRKELAKMRPWIEQGMEKGIKKGTQQERQRQRQEKLNSVLEMAELNISAKDIAKFLRLDIKEVRRELAKKQP